MERRTFIKASCRVCLLGAVGIMVPGLTSLAAAKGKVYRTKVNDRDQLEIPVALFADTNLQIIRVKGWDYDVALHKREDGTYAALLMKCTHMDNQVTLSGEGFQCSMHGSRFDTEGKVLNGPAEVPLTQYKAILNQEIIIISE